MKDTKIYDFLSSMSNTELNRFHRFLESPYHNRNEACKTLFGILEADIRSEKKRVLDKENLYKETFPNTAYNDIKFRKLCSDLLDLGEEFLAIEVYQMNPLHQANYLLQAVHQRQLEKLINSSASKAKLLSDRQYHRPASYYYYQYEIEKNLYKLQNLEVKRASKESIQQINLEKIVQNLDYFYISEKLKYYCSLLSWNKIVSLEHQILFIKEIIQIAEKEEFHNIPPIAIYLRIYYCYIDFENENHYYELKKLIKNHIDIFPIDEAKDIMDSAINYTIQKHNRGKLDYLKENLELYKDALVKEIIFVNEEITPWAYKNIVAIALRLKEFEWTEEFIQTYANRLNLIYKENAINYNMAALYAHKREFKKVIPLLQKVEYDEEYYSLSSKSQLLISYYELKELEVLNAFIESFNIYIKRNKNISKDNKARYSNLILYTRKLVRTMYAEVSELEKLKKEISGSLSVAKSWLLEKVDELIKHG